MIFPAPTNCLELTQKMCEDFLQFFVNEVDNPQLQIISVTTFHAELNYQSSFCSFEPISLPQLEPI